MRQTTIAMLIIPGLYGMITAPVDAQDAPSVEQFTEAQQEQADEDKTSWAVSAGGVFNSGNTRSWALNAGTAFALVRGPHAFGLEWAFNYGRADIPDDGSDNFSDTVRNSNAKVRYDFYLTDLDALFVAVGHRWDTFAGLDTRLQLQAGYLRNFLKQDKHRIWGEVGYDFTYDNFDPEVVQNPDTSDNMECDPTMNPTVTDRPANCQLRTGSQTVHAARLYLGYLNELHENVRVSAGVEALINLNSTDAASVGEDIRVNFDAALRSTIAQSLQLEVKFKLLFDNVPALGSDGEPLAKVDTTTTLSLIYTLI